MKILLGIDLGVFRSKNLVIDRRGRGKPVIKIGRQSGLRGGYDPQDPVACRK